METFHRANGTCLMWVTHTGGLSFLLKPVLKVYIPAGMSAALSCLGEGATAALQLQLLHSPQEHTTQPNSIATSGKGQRPPSSLGHEVRTCPTLEDFLSEHAVSAIQGIYSFVLPRVLVHSHLVPKKMVLKIKIKKCPLSFSASPSLDDHKRFSDP